MKLAFQIGDVVRRAAGTVLMTVEACDTTHVRCAWFAKDSHDRWTDLHRRQFPLDKIVRVRRRAA